MLCLPLLILMNLSYNATVLTIAVDLQHLHNEHSRNISGDREEWQHTLGNEHCNHKKCLVADIKVSGNPEINHLNVEFLLRHFVNEGIVQVLFAVAGSLKFNFSLLCSASCLLTKYNKLRLVWKQSYREQMHSYAHHT